MVAIEVSGALARTRCGLALAQALAADLLTPGAGTVPLAADENGAAHAV